MENNVSLFWNKLDLLSNEIQFYVHEFSNGDIVADVDTLVGTDQYLTPAPPKISQKDFFWIKGRLEDNDTQGDPLRTHVLLDLKWSKTFYDDIKCEKGLVELARATAWRFSSIYAYCIIDDTPDDDLKSDYKQINCIIKMYMLFVYHQVIKDYYESVLGIDILKTTENKTTKRRRRK